MAERISEGNSEWMATDSARRPQVEPTAAEFLTPKPGFLNGEHTSSKR